MLRSLGKDGLDGLGIVPPEFPTEEGCYLRRLQRPHQFNLSCQRLRKKIDKVQVEGTRNHQTRWQRRNVVGRDPTFDRVMVNAKVLRKPVGGPTPTMPHQVFNVL
jgi:hypothetical protein